MVQNVLRRRAMRSCGGWEGKNIMSDKHGPQGLYRHYKAEKGHVSLVFDMPGNAQQPSETGGSVVTQALTHSPHSNT